MYMSRCLELASKAMGNVAPNPMVGAVIVYEDKIIGEGYHRRYGESHAEVNAVDDALLVQPPERLSESTLYVSLEPCSHFGKTPACTELIKSYRFKRVVIGCSDPFEKVNGKGIEILRSAGIEVEENVLKKEAEHLNRRFITYHTKNRPYIILKYAQSKDHFLAATKPDEKNRWISNVYSRKLVHRWRSEEQAIMVGTNTAIVDDPALTVRDWNGKQPLRILLDRKLSVPNSAKLFDQTVNTLVFNELKESIEEKIEFIKLDFRKNVIDQICKILYERSIQSLIVEGGQKLLQSFIDSGIWDEARIITGVSMLNEGLPAPKPGGKLFSSQEIGSDTLEIYYPQNK
ncbi:MAG TPA: bifunctional diaminohydroxyphosphoribosylaminopyrimidine deaminase/5-amino-6-(5-phosphoribosylamino)uracil reductase RibD [Bacteroidia bacterium]|nr:bifunctional diaminohydroxyphosphoribosylaminopyrimidine deaminase/5-amino-6-(5-phosphoribosylamino)uracil reductase RibD [Bacteroidia bacterium]